MSMRVRGEGHLKRTGECILVGKPGGDDVEAGGRIISKWILERYYWLVWTGFIWLRIATSGGPCEHGNECTI
jgi:hypothetical protein